MFKSIKLFFKRINSYIKYEKAVRMADESFAMTGERSYIIKGVGKTGKHQLLIVDRKNFRILKRKGYINHSYRIADVERNCFYCTPYLTGQGTMSEDAKALGKERAINWMMK